MRLDRRPSDRRDPLRPLGLHGMGLTRRFPPFLAALFLYPPVSSSQPGLHLLQVLLLCGVGLLERLYEGVLASLLGQFDERFLAGIIGQLRKQDGFQRLEQRGPWVHEDHLDPVRRCGVQVGRGGHGRGIAAELCDDGL
jgi:hypothetical protein